MKMTVQSSDPADTPADVSDKLEKAYTAMVSAQQSPKKDFPVPYLKHLGDQAETAVNAVFSHMLDEVLDVIGSE